MPGRQLSRLYGVEGSELVAQSLDCRRTVFLVSLQRSESNAYILIILFATSAPSAPNVVLALAREPCSCQKPTIAVSGKADKPSPSRTTSRCQPNPVFSSVSKVTAVTSSEAVGRIDGSEDREVLQNVYDTVAVESLAGLGSAWAWMGRRPNSKFVVERSRPSRVPGSPARRRQWCAGLTPFEVVDVVGRPRFGLATSRKCEPEVEISSPSEVFRCCYQVSRCHRDLSRTGVSGPSARNRSAADLHPAAASP